MNSAKHSIAIAMLMIALTYCGCPFLVPEITAELSDLTLCQGRDANRNPIALHDPVPSDETHICICGHLETNEDVLLQVIWAGRGDVLVTQRQVFGNGPLLSCIEEAGFEPGNYRVTVLMAKKELGYVDFSVSEEPGGSS